VILVGEAVKFVQMNQSSSLQIIEFCIFDEETLAHFQSEFDKLVVH